MITTDAWKSNYKSQQGNLGLGRAIAYYTSKCIPISIPLNDTQGYDLVVDRGKLEKVQVKTTQYRNKETNNFIVQLGNTGGSSGKSIIRKFDRTKSDILFVVTIEGTLYEIPTNVIKSKRAINLNREYEIFKVGNL